MAGDRVSPKVAGKRRSPGESDARSGGRKGNQVQPAAARVEWAPQAFKDYQRWRRVDPPLAGKIDTLISDILRSPFAGIGKPEPLKHKLAGHWSRRINHEHRLVYQYRAGLLSILSCRYHY